MLVAQLGRPGAGPGEFRQLSWAAPGGPDSVWTYDLALKRLSLFAESGKFLDSWNLKDIGFAIVEARLRDGSLVLRRPAMPMPGTHAGLNADSVSILVLRPPFVEPRTVTNRPWYSVFRLPGSSTLISQPFGPAGFVADADSSFWVGFGDRAKIDELGQAGSVLSHVTIASEPTPISADEESSVREQGKKPSDFSGIAALYAGVPIPSNRPALVGLLFDGKRLWVGLRLATDTAAGLWVRSTPMTGALDSLWLPPRLRLLSASDSHLVGLLSGRGGDEYVQVYSVNPSDRR